MIRRLALLGLALAAPALVGYLVPGPKLLERWAREAPDGRPALPAEAMCGWGGGEFLLVVGPHGDLRGEVPPGFPRSAGLAFLLFSDLDPVAWRDALLRAGVDTARTGYARCDASADGVCFTLGARGEGEPELPQVWFSRDPFRPVLVRLSATDAVRVGPPAADGWPAELAPPEPGAPIRRSGAPTPAPEALPPPPNSLPDDWRKAF
ncbi:MAG: hypothetical protein D6708_09540 [Candidatus Dadabacteria bacterium]|nr:MAG: hypothetical protein D6708_09540 [Candidatus Dadabacteria bacterium]